MLRMQTLGATLIVLAASAGAAAAADLSQPYTPPPAQAYTPTPAWSWTGPYVGLTGGLGVEAALSKRVTGRVEWRYTDLGTTNGSSVTSSDLMLGVAVKF